MDEKDNFAVHFLDGAWSELFDVAVATSNDNDLVKPLRMVTDRRQELMHIGGTVNQHVAPMLRQATCYVWHVRASRPRETEFPDTIPGAVISRPAESNLRVGSAGNRN